jgi:hypothetical protein
MQLPTSLPCLNVENLPCLIYKCCGSGSRSVNICKDPDLTLFVRIWILQSSSKISKKNFHFYCFVTSLWLLILEEWCKCNLQKVISKITWHLEGHWRKEQDPVPDPSISCTDPDPYQNVMDPQHCYLKGLSHEIDFKKFDKNLQYLA